jgi:hypothetical protein
VLTSLRRAGAGGALVAMLGGRVGPEDVGALQRLRQSHPQLTLVRFVVSRTDRDRATAGELIVDDEHPFAEVWDDFRRSSRYRRVRVAR